jgi:hypothetical protein
VYGGVPPVTAAVKVTRSLLQTDVFPIIDTDNGAGMIETVACAVMKSRRLVVQLSASQSSNLADVWAVFIVVALTTAVQVHVQVSPTFRI